MPKAGYTSYSEEKFHSVFATRLREELAPTAEDAKKLAEHLGITVQAVNQYKQGQGFPKTENLIKVAVFYDCSLDYLIGLSDVKNPDSTVQDFHEYTGLSEDAIRCLCTMNQPDNLGGDPNILYAIDRLLVALKRDECYALVDITDFLETDFNDLEIAVAHYRINEKTAKKIASSAMERAALEEIGNSLKELKGKYYQEVE